LSFADQLAVMRHGRLVQSGHPLDLYRYPEDEQTALFLGDAVVMPARIEAGWAHCDLGRIPVNNHRNNHSAQIMLRPEQLQLASVLPDDTGVAGCRAKVIDRDFSGNTCTLTVELQPRAPDQPIGRSLLVRSSGMYAPPAGSAVQVSTIGHAHVLSEP
jgi:iron(III) transport system ATP-binding protein